VNPQMQIFATPARLADVPIEVRLEAAMRILRDDPTLDADDRRDLLLAVACPGLFWGAEQ
jgi:hypothetical protein